MARISMSTPKKATVEEVFGLYLSAVTSEGVADKTLATYKQHFHAISKRLDVAVPISSLKNKDLEKMIFTSFTAISGIFCGYFSMQQLSSLCADIYHQKTPRPTPFGADRGVFLWPILQQARFVHC